MSSSLQIARTKTKIVKDVFQPFRGEGILEPLVPKMELRRSLIEGIRHDAMSANARIWARPCIF